MRIILGLILIVAAEVLYDTYCEAPLPDALNISNTNWSVVYFACLYTTMMIFSFEYFTKKCKLYVDNVLSYIREGKYEMIFVDFFKLKGFSERGLITVVFLFFTCLLYIDLSLINVPFDQYLTSVSDRMSSDVVKLVTLIFLLILLIVSWVKRGRK